MAACVAALAQRSADGVDAGIAGTVATGCAGGGVTDTRRNRSGDGPPNAETNVSVVIHNPAGVVMRARTVSRSTLGNEAS